MGEAGWRQEGVMVKKTCSQAQENVTVQGDTPYPPDEVASEASSSQSESEDYSESSLTTDVHTTAGAKPDQKAEPNLKHRWLDGTFCPKMRPLRWPDIRSIRST